MLSIRFLTLIAVLGTMGCDPEGKTDCVWTLEPEPKNLGTTAAGMIPLCARNRVTMKQDCRLQAPLDFAKDAYGRKFRYSELTVKSYGIPRTVDAIKYCD
jgi:hypothetical protein